MGLLRIIDKKKAEKYCKPLPLDDYNYFYPCTKGKCFKKYDKGTTFSTNGKTYKLCMLFMQESDFDSAVMSKIEKAREIFREFYKKFLPQVYLEKSCKWPKTAFTPRKVKSKSSKLLIALIL